MGLQERGLLSVRRLDEFRQWLETTGKEVLPSVPFSYEVLRWRGRPGRPMPIIFNRHSASDHFTCNAAAVPYVRRFIRETRISREAV